MTQAARSPAEEVGFYQKGLYKLLDTTFQERKFRTVQGLLSIPALGDAVEMSHEGIYKWIRADRITPDGARKLIDLAGGRLTKSSFLSFLL